MLSAIIELVVGWFMIYKVPNLIGIKGTFSVIIKIIGVILLIAGFISMIHYLF